MGRDVFSRSPASSSTSPSSLPLSPKWNLLFVSVRASSFALYPNKSCAPAKISSMMVLSTLLVHFLLAVFAEGSVQVTYYVSPQGNDAWSGLLPDPNPTHTDGPFLTPYAGGQAVYNLSRPLTGTVNIFLRSGLYELNDTLVLGPGSGGDSPASSIVWARAPTDSDPVILSGGVRVSGWVETEEAGIWRAPLPPGAPNRTRSLFATFDSEATSRRTPARVPPPSLPGREHLYSDASTLHFTGLLDHSPLEGPCWGRTDRNASINQWGFVYNGTDPRSPSPSWVDIQGMDVLVFGAWTASWGRVAAVHGENHTLYTANPLVAAVPGAWGGLGCPGGARYVLFNAREGLIPGSGYYYVNDTSREIFYAPYPGEDMTTLALSVPVLPTVLSVQGDDCGGPLYSISFEHLSIRHASDGGMRDKDQGNEVLTGAFALTSAADITVINCDISHNEGSGVYLQEDLIRVTLFNNTVGDMGGDGIGLALVYSQDGGYPVNTTIANNTVHGVGHVFMSQPSGIRVQGDPQGTVSVVHNHVSSSTYAGIMVGWQDGVTAPDPGFSWQFQVEGNLVEDCGLQTLSDFGGIYISTSGFKCEGTHSCYLPTLVHNNLVRGTRGYNYGGEGVYCDENVAGVTITGNVLGNVSGSSIYLHCGDNQTVSGNLVFGSHATPLSTFGTGLFGGCNTGGVDPIDENITATVTTNVWMVTTQGGSIFNHGQIYPTADETYTNNVYWSTQTPPTLNFPVTPAINSSFAQWQAVGEDVGGVVADPLVADLAAGNFTLLPGSPALQRGFQQIEGGWGTTMSQPPTSRHSSQDLPPRRKSGTRSKCAN